MKRIHHAFIAAFLLLSVFLRGTAFGADNVHYYGVVESYGGGQVVVKTTKHSTGTWTVDSATKVEGSIAKYDWVFVDVSVSGHVAVLRFEQRPTGRAGVVKVIQNRVLTVHSGNSMEKWNVTDSTLGDTAVAVGDEIGCKVYSNRNLAEVTIIKHGVQ
jgi:hypothetical protein